MSCKNGQGAFRLHVIPYMEVSTCDDDTFHCFVKDTPAVPRIRVNFAPGSEVNIIYANRTLRFLRRQWRA